MKDSVQEGAQVASLLAELNVGSIATVTSAGDLVVSINDLVEDGPSWETLLSLIPFLKVLPVAAIIFATGKFKLRIPKALAEAFGRLTKKQQKHYLKQAAAAKNKDEAMRILKGGAALGPADEHHISTNKNWKSSLRGGPWSPRFEKIFQKASMTLEDVENKIYLPGHNGSHSEDYHRKVFQRLSDAVSGRSGEAYRAALVKELNKIHREILTPNSELRRLLLG